jgi:hypothetical protein
MRSGLTVAFALGLTFASCSVYDPSLLTGDGVEGGQGSARGGASSKGGSAGTGGVLMGGRAGSGGGGLGGGGPSAGSSGTSGTSAGGDAGVAGEAGAAGEDGAGGSGGGSGDGAGGAGGSTSSGGTAGGGTSGDGGRAGAGAPAEAGGAGLAGSAGAGGSGGSAGAEVCSGCARLSVPLASATDQAHFLVTLPANTDFTTAVVTFRVLCKAGSGGQLRGYVQHGGSPDFDFRLIGITELAGLGSWTSVSYDLSEVTDYDKTVVRRVGVEITGKGSSTWLNPTIVYLDSIEITNTALDPSIFGFDDAASIFVTPSTAGPPDQRLWMNDATNDSNVAATLSWLGP